MSSALHQPIGSFDISTIRNALRHAGFRHEEPLCELDRGAARHAITLYQKGVRRSGDLTPAVNLWADKTVLTRQKHNVQGSSL
ncbi:hypothetical protein [Rhizobium sp. AAP116]|uniref:hypothetical protein n=1 Tax=unclassified Rhizobium TaxID=2613769 RepID=UPI0006B9C4F1|nr:hypothetical protein [Rhizobium sp. AAP116]KPF55103.1 hypothetical protein IP85_16290 [Rhizobium sp. AAP116]MDM7979094.1 hypothetical protein [Rhizobium sp.]MDM8015532.1 hypothetical protein [Rhizobium sp.]MDZ7875875.1 hypothetical protein [Rhizobium sp.]